MPGKSYPNEKEKLLKELSPDEIKTIQKDNPFKHERDEKIIDILNRGVSCHVLSEITGGLCKSSIHRLGMYGSNRKPLIRTNQEDDLRKIEDAFNEFSKAIKIILKHRRK